MDGETAALVLLELASQLKQGQLSEQEYAQAVKELASGEHDGDGQGQEQSQSHSQQ